jgi:hypothetical protein
VFERPIELTPVTQQVIYLYQVIQSLFSLFAPVNSNCFFQVQLCCAC